MKVTISRIKKWDKEKNVSMLIDALQTNETELRKAICLSLGESKSADALLALRYLEKNDSDEFVRITANRSISYMIDNVSEMPYIQFAEEVKAPKFSYIPI
jgi:HEAT repeat protein